MCATTPYITINIHVHLIMNLKFANKYSSELGVTEGHG